MGSLCKNDRDIAEQSIKLGRQYLKKRRGVSGSPPVRPRKASILDHIVSIKLCEENAELSKVENSVLTVGQKLDEALEK